MARIVIAGAGAIGASIAYQLALRGAGDVVLAERAGIASGSTGKAMGGVRQQFSTEAEVRLARESIGFFRELGPPYFDQVGYLFFATTDEGLETLERRAELQRGLGVPVEDVDASRIAGLRTDDVVGAVVCWEDGGGQCCSPDDTVDPGLLLEPARPGPRLRALPGRKRPGPPRVLQQAAGCERGRSRLLQRSARCPPLRVFLRAASS